VSACLSFAMVCRRGRKFTVRRGSTTLEVATSGLHNVGKNPVFWDITSCSPLKVKRCFGGASVLYLQCRTIIQQETSMKHVTSTTSSELALCHEDVWDSGSRAPPFLTSALDGVEWSDSRPGRFSSEERALGTCWMGGWVGSRAGVDSVEERKNLHFRESDPCHPTRILSLYRLRFPTSLRYSIYLEINFRVVSRMGVKFGIFLSEMNSDFMCLETKC
jgi:hypothetical protein